MNKTVKSWLIFGLFILISSQSFAGLINQAPGETFTPGSAKSGTPLLQTAGVPFYVTVYAADATNNLINTGGTGVTISASTTATFSNYFFNLTQSQGTAACKQYVTITLNNPSTQSVIITTNEQAGGIGLAPATVTVTSQVINNFDFAYTGTWTAGQGKWVTITAQQAGPSTVTSFNGSGALSLRYTYGRTVSLGTVNFTGGFYYGFVTPYASTLSGETAAIRIVTTQPSFTDDSANITVAAGGLDRLLVLGPGQTYLGGTSTGNGRVGASETTSQQTAGTYFWVTVVACDAYWNTVTAATGNVTVAVPTDPQAVITGSPATLAAGKAYVQVELRRVSGSNHTLNVTHNGSASADTVAVPLTNGALDHFMFSGTITNKIAGEQFTPLIIAQDLNNNTVTSFNQASGITMSAWAGAVSISAANVYFDDPVIFTSGQANVNSWIFERKIGVQLRVSFWNGALRTGLSNSFTVDPDAFTKLLTIAPGEVFDKGNFNAGGKYGAADNANTGSPVNVSVYATDNYGNIHGEINNQVVRINSTDVTSTIGGNSLPQYVTLGAGQASFNITFRDTGTQQVTATYIPDAGINAGSSDILVAPSALGGFSFSTISQQVAGVTTTATITALDTYGNPKTDWQGIVWITSPYTDWTYPFESTINISGSNIYTSGHRWGVSITASDNGSRTLSIAHRRAMTNNRLFAAVNEADTISNTTGAYGTSNQFNIIAAAKNRLQVIPPGVEPRPGTLDGENGKPTGFFKSAAIGVTVYACDYWWNQVNTGDRLYVDVNLRTGSTIEGSAVTPYTTKSLTAGKAIYDIRYSNTSSNYVIEARDQDDGSVGLDFSQPMQIFNIDHFGITSSDGIMSPSISTQTAGVAFGITITAWANAGETLQATDFTGEVSLATNFDASGEYYMTPGTSPTFTAGVCVMQVTVYRASRTTSGGGGIKIKPTFGPITSESTAFTVAPKAPVKCLVLPEGMSIKPGLAHASIPNYFGYTGSPAIATAGSQFGLKVYYVDENYNEVYWWPTAYCKLTSTDPLASIEAINLQSPGIMVTITAGSYDSSLATGDDMVLRTAGIQRITGDPEQSFVADSEPPQINISVKHTTASHVGVLVPTSGYQVAGVPFNITIVAYDDFNNICDDKYTGEPFNFNVKLSASTGSNTMYPEQYLLNNGFAIAPVRMFKSAGSVSVNGTYGVFPAPGAISGTSQNLAVEANEFKRLMIIPSKLPPILGDEMDLNSGVYTVAPPSEFVGYAGMPETRTVNDDYNTPTGYDFYIYSCDSYGNVTKTADAHAYTITVSTNDPYAIPVTQTTISDVDGRAVVKMIFHTAMSGVTVGAKADGPTTIASFNTPGFPTNAGTFYGLQLIVPGLQRIQGSGYLDSLSEWHNGVTYGTEHAQLQNQPFKVTVYACDKYGNFVQSAPSHNVRVTSTDGNTGAYPRGGAPFYGTLNTPDAGIATLNASFVTTTDINMDVLDTTAPGAPPTGNNPIWNDTPTIRVTDTNNLGFRIDINGVRNVNGTEAAPAIVDPAVLTIAVYVVDLGTTLNPVVATNKSFNILPVIGAGTQPTSPAHGILRNVSTQVQFPGGTTSAGVFTANVFGYTVAENLRFRVVDSGGTTYPATAWSPLVVFSGNPATAGLNLSAQSNNVGGGKTVQVYADIRSSDGLSNPLTGTAVDLFVVSGKGTFPGGVTRTTAITDGNGRATVDFIAGYENAVNVINGQFFNGTANEAAVRPLNLNVSLVDPVAGQVSNYPNPFRAGVESTHIDYLLTEDTDVSINIYTLFGSLVWNKEIRRGEAGGIGGMVNSVEWNGKTKTGDIVGNGGYICTVEAMINGEKKKMVRKIAVAK